MEPSTTKGEKREQQRRKRRHGMRVGPRPDLLRPAKLSKRELEIIKTSDDKETT